MFLAVTLLLLPAFPASGQENPKSDERSFSPLKIQIVFTEFEGDKKVKSLPYTMVFTAGSRRDAEFAKLRVGSRIPVLVGKEGNFQYVDVGTNLDCRAEHLEDGRYALRLSLERSWVQANVRIAGDDSTSTSGGNPAFNQPVIGQYKADAYLLARDGQTVETTVATDPLSGKQLKIEVTLNIPK
ncbi:MAG: hypothetical protein JO260_09135 [Acidobacteria bacterium]|nr:hypothetical protein [Acidobacteriota bacterium]